ncbi:MAG: vitamin B12 dependent-methionine synthase activation domain-containing protein [Ignavibacteria bacterium]|jgi:hypothetical protein
MKQRVTINLNDIIPESKDVFNHQGIPKGSVIPDRVNSLFREAVSVFKEKAELVAIIKEVTITEFGDIFEGEKKNEDQAPLENIYPESDYLSVFAISLGAGIVKKINDLFAENDFASGAMLDSVASLAADKSVEVLEKFLFNDLLERNLTKNKNVVLAYSPGYCGWDLSGQKKLFEYLKPEEIGITLNDSFLMSPLKSVSGVLVYASKEVHTFENSFTFCGYCRNQTCHDRINNILNIDL